MKSILMAVYWSMFVADDELFIRLQGRERRAILSQEEKRDLLRSFHGYGSGPHRGKNGTYDRLKSSFYWEKMREDVNLFVSFVCLMCVCVCFSCVYGCASESDCLTQLLHE